MAEFRFQFFQSLGHDAPLTWLGAGTRTSSPAARHIAPPRQKPSMAQRSQAERSQDSGDGYICYDAYVQNIGWQGWQCDGDVAGTVGQSLRMEAIEITVTG